MSPEEHAAAGAASLPKSLCYSWRPRDDNRVDRRLLSKLTADGACRIVYGIADASQSFPQRGLLLVGRRLMGWVVSTGWEREVEKPGEIAGQKMEALLPADPSLMHRYGNANDVQREMALLRCQTNVIRGESLQDHWTSMWDRNTAEDLTYQFGMVQVVESSYPNRYDGHLFKTVGALLPKEDSSTWECVDLQTARWRAERDAETPAFWKLWKRTYHYRSEVEAPRFDVECLGSYLVSNNETLTPGIVAGAITIRGVFKHHGAGELVLEGDRNYSDNRWRYTLRREGRLLGSHVYPVVTGAAALRIAEIAMLAAALPEPATTPDDEAAGLLEFGRAIYEVHQRSRTLGFVCEALGIEDVSTPGPAVVRENTLGHRPV